MYYKIVNDKKKAATRAADMAGYALWAPLRLFGKKKLPAPENVREVLVIRTAYIGDVIMTMPMLKPLKELYPKARITFLTSRAAAPLFKGSPYVDSVLEYNAFWFYPSERKKDYFEFLKTLRQRHYDIVIEARADIRDIGLLAWRSRAERKISYGVGGGGFLLTDLVPYERVKHRVEYHLDFAKYLGAKPGELDWGIRITPEEEKAAEALLRGAGGLKVGIHAGGRKGLKCWGAEKFAHLARAISDEHGASVFFTGDAKERELAEEIIERAGNKGFINLAGKTDLRTLLAVIKKLDLFITNDSSPLHMASAMKTPTVAIFGPSKSNETGPYGNAHRVVEKDFPCRQTCDEDVCLQMDKQACMTNVTVEDALFAVKEVIRESSVKKELYGAKA